MSVFDRREYSDGASGAVLALNRHPCISRNYLSNCTLNSCIAWHTGMHMLHTLCLWQDDIMGVARFIDACLERVYTSAGPPVGDQASDQP